MKDTKDFALYQDDHKTAEYEVVRRPSKPSMLTRTSSHGSQTSGSRPGSRSGSASGSASGSGSGSAPSSARPVGLGSIDEQVSLASGPSLVSNNSLPSLISQTDAIFPKLECGAAGTVSEGHSRVSGVYNSLVGIERTNGPQTKNDLQYHKTQAERGILTKFNAHLLQDKTSKNSTRSNSTGEDTHGLWGVAAMKSNDIFGTIQNGSKAGKKRREAALEAKREKEKNARMMRAFELSSDARSLKDPTRLLFEAAIIYDDLNIYDKAIAMYEKATIPCSPEEVVDAYDLTEDEGFERRMERMAASHRREYLRKRAMLRKDLIFAEEERQRLRSLVSKCQLVRLYLLIDDFPAAHKNMTESFSLTKADDEHTELLYYFHDVLKEYSNKCFGELSKMQQVARGSAGPLAEAHLAILHELLEQDGRNAEVLEWLGKRYAEKLDFSTSYGYYKRATDMREPVRSAVDARDMWISRGDTDIGGDEATRIAISKSTRMEFQNPELQNDIDYRSQDYIESGNRDYSWPERRHEGSTCVLYEKPGQGWDYGIKMQKQRYKDRGEEFKLPKGTTYVLTDRELGLEGDGFTED